uniref:Uncharacterized protein n=1 Tax=Oryza sativa subsp. japonica TaxID=39947 RepID=Q8H5A6_ORYSJ|nr:hypothetical protein [Oryza sativa Japonica Group]
MEGCGGGESGGNRSRSRRRPSVGRHRHPSIGHRRRPPSLILPPRTRGRRSRRVPFSRVGHRRPPPPLTSTATGRPPTRLALAPSGPAKPVPLYGKRGGFVPRRLEDFGDGGAFPEILALTVDAKGSVAFNAIVKQGENAARAPAQPPPAAARSPILPSPLRASLACRRRSLSPPAARFHHPSPPEGKRGVELHRFCKFGESRFLVLRLRDTI